MRLPINILKVTCHECVRSDNIKWWYMNTKLGNWFYVYLLSFEGEWLVIKFVIIGTCIQARKLLASKGKIYLFMHTPLLDFNCLIINNQRYNIAVERSIGVLACVWILYLKVISRIFMHRIHSAKNLRCLVGILENAKCILQILISRAEVKI